MISVNDQSVIASQKMSNVMIFWLSQELTICYEHCIKKILMVE